MIIEYIYIYVDIGVSQAADRRAIVFVHTLRVAAGDDR